jgi:hypothetical protein
MEDKQPRKESDSPRKLSASGIKISVLHILAVGADHAGIDGKEGRRMDKKRTTPTLR